MPHQLNPEITAWGKTDEAAYQEGLAIEAHRAMVRQTRIELGMGRKVSKSQTKRHGMVRGCIGAKARANGIRVDSTTASHLGKRIPLGMYLKLSELREEKE